MEILIHICLFSDKFIIPLFQNSLDLHLLFVAKVIVVSFVVVRVTAVSQSGKPIPVLNMSTASEKVSHTTTTSLIAALVFGVVFLIAVAVQIGKPWWESMLTNRDGYSRITFLMNGK